MYDRNALYYIWIYKVIIVLSNTLMTEIVHTISMFLYNVILPQKSKLYQRIDIMNDKNWIIRKCTHFDFFIHHDCPRIYTANQPPPSSIIQPVHVYWQQLLTEMLFLLSLLISNCQWGMKQGTYEDGKRIRWKASTCWTCWENAKTRCRFSANARRPCCLRHHPGLPLFGCNDFYLHYWKGLLNVYFFVLYFLRASLLLFWFSVKNCSYNLGE